MKKRFSVLSTLCAPLFKYYVSQLIFAFHEKLKVFLSVRIQLEKVRKLLSGFSLVYKFLEHRGVQFSCIGSYGRFSLYDLKK